MEKQPDQRAPSSLLQAIREQLDLSSRPIEAPEETLLGQLQSADWQQRVVALHELSERHIAIPFALASRLLRDADPSVRAAAAYYLGHTSDVTSVDLVVEALGDPDWLVRENALLALGELGAAGVPVPQEQLEHSLEDAQEFVRESADLALFRARHEEGRWRQSSKLHALLAVFKRVRPIDISAQIEIVEEPLPEDEELFPVITDLNSGSRVHPRTRQLSLTKRAQYLLTGLVAAALVLTLLVGWLFVLPRVQNGQAGAPEASLAYSISHLGSLSLPAWASDVQVVCRPQLGALESCGTQHLGFVDGKGHVYSWNAQSGVLTTPITVPVGSGFVVITGDPNNPQTIYQITGSDLPGRWDWLLAGRYIVNYYPLSQQIDPHQEPSVGLRWDIWDVLSGKKILTLGSHLFALSQDGQWLAALTDQHTIQVISLNFMEQGFPAVIQTLSSPQFANLVSLNWSPGGDQLATASSDGTIQVWERANPSFVLHTIHVLPTLPALSLAQITMDWSPDMQSLATIPNGYGDNPPIEVWNLQTGQLRTSYTRHTAQPEDLTWLGNDILSSSENELAIWDTTTGQTRLSVKLDPMSLYSGLTWQISADGNWLLVPTSSGLQLINLGSKNMSRGTLLKDSLLSTVLSPDSTRLATVNVTGEVQIWNIQSGQIELAYQLPNDFKNGGAKDNYGSTSTDLAWSPDSSLLAVTYVGGSGGLVVLHTLK